MEEGGAFSSNGCPGQTLFSFRCVLRQNNEPRRGVVGRLLSRHLQNLRINNLSLVLHGNLRTAQSANKATNHSFY